MAARPSPGVYLKRAQTCPPRRLEARPISSAGTRARAGLIHRRLEARLPGSRRGPPSVTASLRGGDCSPWSARDRRRLETGRLCDRCGTHLRAGRSGRGARPDGFARDACCRSDARRHRVCAGREGAATGTPTDTIVAVDLAHRRLPIVGRLPQPLSDLAAVGLGDRILVAGGRGRGGTVAALTTSDGTLSASRSPQRNRGCRRFSTRRMSMPLIVRTSFTAPPASPSRGSTFPIPSRIRST